MDKFGATKKQEKYKMLIISTLGEIRDLMVEKNTKYGCSMFEDGMLFDAIYMSAQDGIMTRLHDKFKRLGNEVMLTGEMQENDIIDAIGYMVGLLINQREIKENETPSGQVINQ